MPAIEIRDIRRLDDRGRKDAIVEFSVHHADGTLDVLQVRARNAPDQADELRAMAWDLLAGRLGHYGHLAPANDSKAA